MSKYHLNTLRGPRREHRPCPVPDAQPSTRPSTPAVPAGSASAALCCPTQGVHLNRPLAYHLRKLQDRGRGRPALGLEIGITLAETAETPAMARPPDIATESRAGRKGRKGRKPIFRGPYRYASIPGMATGRKNGTAVVQFDSSSAVGRANGNWRTWVLWCPLTQGGRGEAPRAIRKFPIFSMQESRKPRAMVLTYSGLLRLKVLIVMRKSVCSRLKVSLEGMLESFTRHTSETVNLTV